MCLLSRCLEAGCITPLFHLCSVQMTENTASSIVACWTLFTELFPGNMLIKSVTITCSLAYRYQHSGRNCCLHFQGIPEDHNFNVSAARNFKLIYYNISICQPLDYSIIYGLFNEAVSSSDYTELNGRMIRE
jgi:hypothetical protein